MDDEPRAGDLSSDEGRSSTGYRGVDGSGDPSGRISPEQAASEAELERLAEQASQVALLLPGLTVQQAADEVARTPALYIRFIGEGDMLTEDCGWGRITALIQGNMVTKASAG